MRTIVLHNCSAGHDKVYRLEVTQSHPNAPLSWMVTARWGRRDTAYGQYGLSPDAQSVVKMSGASLSQALRCAEDKSNEKQERGYRLVSRVDGGASAPVVPVVPFNATGVPSPVRRPVRRRRPALYQPANAQSRGVVATEWPSQRPRVQSDDCGNNPVAVGAISAADFWKR